MSAIATALPPTGAVSYRSFATPRELERLLADDLAVLLSESFHGAAADPGTPGEAELPAGTVTFLLADIEGSTRLWEAEPDAMSRLVALHDQVLRAAFERHGGVVFSATGAAMAAAFWSAAAAASAALEAQRALFAASWPEQTGVPKVRMGLHTDEASHRDGQYAGVPVNRGASLMAAAHGGQIVMSGATAALVRSELPDDAALVDLGEHRLPDLADPLRIFQLTHPDLPTGFPALQSQAGCAGNLLVPVSSFIGRGRELERTIAALDQARVVTLAGMGGAGKTRLAIQVAGQMQPRFANGVWLCELAPVRDAAAVDEAVAAVFPVTARAGQGTRDALLEFLRGKQLLLVLDNCEHLLAGAATLAEVLARSCPRLAILATSREGLGIDGEQLIPVPSLGLPGADAGPEAIRQAEAVRLFTDRAVAVKPDFMVTEQNAAAVAADAYVVESPMFAQLISLIVTQALGEERARELRARGADMDWDQALAYTLTQATQALGELRSETSDHP